MNATLTNIHRNLNLLLLAMTLLFAGGLIYGCGGGGGGGGGTGSTTTSTLSAGQVTQASSIIVNGIHFETEGAELEFENESPEIIAGDDSAIRNGMQAEVRGPVDDSTGNGTATSIRIEDTVEGPVMGTPVETTADLILVLNVLGQNVVLENGFTVFDAPLTFNANFAGKILEVHGPILTNADGTTTVQATYVEEKASGGLLEVKGFAKNVTASQFDINGLNVTYNPANVQNGPLAEGDLVEVKGTAFDSITSTLTASFVEVEGGFEDIDEAEVEGFISSLPSASTFMINGQLVDHSNAQFLGGLAAELAIGVKVEAEGPIVGGTLLAEKVKFKESVKLESNLRSKTGNTLILQGLPGIVVTIDNSSTRIEGTTDLAGAQLDNGVKIRARLSGASGNTLIATRFEALDSPLNDAQIQGQASDFNSAAGTVVILGITVNTTDPGFEFEGLTDNPLTSGEFFAALNANPDAVIEARKDLASGLWEQIELEDED